MKCFCTAVSCRTLNKVGRNAAFTALQVVFLRKGNLVMKSVDVFTMWFVVLEVQSSDTLQPPAG
jgi:hypothetical protein